MTRKLMVLVDAPLAGAVTSASLSAGTAIPFSVPIGPLKPGPIQAAATFSLLVDPTIDDIKAWLDGYLGKEAILRDWAQHVERRQLVRELVEAFAEDPQLATELRVAMKWVAESTEQPCSVWGCGVTAEPGSRWCKNCGATADDDTGEESEEVTS